MYQPRQILAYGTLSIFIVFILFYGFTDSLMKMYPVGMRSTWGSLNSLKTQKDSNMSFPDLSRYERLKTLTSKEFPLDDPTRRVIIVGDIHGMIKSFEKLLKRVKYSPDKDVLVHVGDLVAKGPHTGSLSVLRYMASNDITGVRGNHDQKVIEWRGWLDWISSVHEASAWLDSLEDRWNKAQPNDTSLNLKSWLEKERKSSPRSEKVLWRLIPTDWTVFSDHYKIAKDMSEEDFNYLLKLPLRLYIPSAHAFIVHAGLLPSDPRYSRYDKSRQPLADIPTLPQRPTAVITMSRDKNSIEDVNNDPASSTNTTDNLRNLQEIGILTQIPQNTKPWVVLNIRGVVNGKISRKPNTGTPWAEMWEDHMEHCVGFNHELKRRHIEKDNGSGENDDQDDPDLNAAKKRDLLCYPSTTVFGHTASRGLDIKRWHFGLDTGCIYEKRLSALVIEGFIKGSRRHLDSESTMNHTSDEGVHEEGIRKDGSVDGSHSLPFGDRNSATVMSVKCRR